MWLAVLRILDLAGLPVALLLGRLAPPVAPQSCGVLAVLSKEGKVLRIVALR